MILDCVFKLARQTRGNILGVKRGVHYWLILSLLLSSMATQATELTGSLHLRGSTTLLPLAQRVAEAYMEKHPKIIVNVSGGGTQRGYKSLLDGTADLALVSSDPSEEIQQSLARRKQKTRAVNIAYSALVVAVHPHNPINSITLPQLQEVFSGRLNNWKNLGGEDAPIHVLIGPPSGGITEVWKSRVLGDNNTYTPLAAVMSAQERHFNLSTDTNAITYLPLNESGDGIKSLAVNRVSPSKENIHNGKYPLRTALSLVSLVPATPLIQDFSRFMQTRLQEMSEEHLIAAVEEIQ